MADGRHIEYALADPANGVPTYEVLTSLGFLPDVSLMSDPPGGLRMDFGNVKLTAIHCLSRRFANVVQLGGVMEPPGSLVLVECEMPQVVKSKELGIAWVTWCLDSHAHGEFQPAKPAPWLIEGRRNRHLLPWAVDHAD